VIDFDFGHCSRRLTVDLHANEDLVVFERGNGVIDELDTIRFGVLSDDQKRGKKIPYPCLWYSIARARLIGVQEAHNDCQEQGIRETYRIHRSRIAFPAEVAAVLFCNQAAANFLDDLQIDLEAHQIRKPLFVGQRSRIARIVVRRSVVIVKHVPLNTGCSQVASLSRVLLVCGRIMERVISTTVVDFLLYYLNLG